MWTEDKRAKRLVRWLQIVIVCTLAAAVLPLAAHPFRARAVAKGGPITDLIKLPGDQVVTVPDGVYTGGVVSAAHPATAGPYKGWLVLVAESQRGVVVDLTNGPLTLDVGTSRVLFVGFKFINGLIIQRGDDVGFWYTEHTFPIEEWNRQYQAAGGTCPQSLTKMANPIPKAIWVGEETTHTVLRTLVLGSDIHDVGDDGVFVDHSQGAVIQGDRIWNVDRKSYDPGCNPWSTQYHDLFHNDSVQIPGSVTDFTMADSYASPTITVGGDNANTTNANWSNLWIADSFGLGMQLYSQNNYRLAGSMRDIRAWSNGTQHQDDPGWDQLRVDFVDNKQAVWPQSLNDPRLNVTSTGSNVNQQAPPGVSMSGRRMNDETQALDSSQNPANVWRASHPYNSWAANVFGQGTPSAPSTPSNPPTARALPPNQDSQPNQSAYGQPAQIGAATGYWLVSGDGKIFNFGNHAPFGSPNLGSSRSTIAAVTSTASGNGYHLVTDDGHVFAYGDAQFFGPNSDLHPNQPIIGMSAVSGGKGYWLTAADGGIFAFGDARFFGSAGGMRLNQPINGVGSTPSGKGYWQVARDGGIFAFGDAKFFGSAGGKPLNQPIVGMTPTPSGKGYWLVARDGGIFAYGDAKYFGSTGGFQLRKPIVGMKATPSGKGYWLVAADGGIFSFGDAPFLGSTGAVNLSRPIIGMA